MDLLNHQQLENIPVRTSASPIIGQPRPSLLSVPVHTAQLPTLQRPLPIVPVVTAPAVIASAPIVYSPSAVPSDGGAPPSSAREEAQGSDSKTDAQPAATDQMRVLGITMPKNYGYATYTLLALIAVAYAYKKRNVLKQLI